MAINLARRCTCGIELTATTTGATPVAFGPLLQVPAIIIFDNQSSNAVKIYLNQTVNVWRTFPAGEALILDTRSAQGKSDNFAFAIGDTFYASGTAGSLFSISYVYAVSK